MEIYLLRHGIAELQGRRSISDCDRLLTPEGKRKLRRTGRWLVSRKDRPGLILSSPYRRAVQSAEVIREFFPDAKLRLSGVLTPEGDVRKAAQLLVRQNPAVPVLISSHEPFLGKFSSYLITSSSQAVFEFKKAGLMKLFWETPSVMGGGALMEWFVSPGLLPKKGARL